MIYKGEKPFLSPSDPHITEPVSEELYSHKHSKELGAKISWQKSKTLQFGIIRKVQQILKKKKNHFYTPTFGRQTPG